MAGQSAQTAPSIRDVAQAAGVSVSTVSRAFSIPSLVRHDTLARVLAVAGELGYRPNRAARGLATGKTGNIGVIVPDLGNPFFTAILKGAQARAREADYAIFLADAEENPRLELELVRAMAKQVDGVIICSSRLTESQLQQLLSATTLVLLNRRIRHVSAVQFDNSGGIRQAVGHLVALGHQRVAYLAGPVTSWSNRDRKRGLRASTRAYGIEFVELGPFAPDFEAGYHAADLVLAADVTAAIAYNDLVALGVLSRFADRGVSVPEEISIVGFDDIPMAGMATPHLTTVALPLELAGRMAVELLLERLADPGPDSNHEQQLGARLIVRASTAPPGKGAWGGSRIAWTAPTEPVVEG